MLNARLFPAYVHIPYFIYYGALHLIIVLTHSFYKYYSLVLKDETVL